MIEYMLRTQASSKKELGQYFTVSEDLQEFVFNKVQHKSSRLLEPSFGAGHLLKKFKEYDPNYPMTCFELDDRITPVVEFNEHQSVTYGDFTKQALTQRFKTIIGNPPYVKQRSSCNLYIKFIQLCYNYLDDDGELIFIVPSDFTKLTSAASIITTMANTGSFTDVLLPNNEGLFEGASIDVIVFRYQKGVEGRKTIVNGVEMFCNVRNGIITFDEVESTGQAMDELFAIYVGIVSGRDEIYLSELGNIEVLVDQDKHKRFIFAESFPTNDERINEHLLQYKTLLQQRSIRNFTEANWWEWGAPRNISSIRAAWGRPCVYVKNMTRSKEVAFVGTVQYFGGSLLCLIPKKEMNDDELKRVVDYLNGEAFRKGYTYSGRFKIGQKQISNARLAT